MANVYEKIICCVMSISFQERRKKELERYRQELKRFRDMEADELEFEYINLKSEYEHRKNVITIFMLSIVIAVFMDAWQYFFSFIEKTIQYAVAGQGNEVETAKIVFIFSVLIIAFITVFVFMILIAHTKRMNELNKKLMIVEEIRKKRNDKG